jgi:hypothetical protein
MKGEEKEVRWGVFDEIRWVIAGEESRGRERKGE